MGKKLSASRDRGREREAEAGIPRTEALVRLWGQQLVYGGGPVLLLREDLPHLTAHTRMHTHTHTHTVSASLLRHSGASPSPLPHLTPPQNSSPLQVRSGEVRGQSASLLWDWEGLGTGFPLHFPAVLPKEL